VACIWDSNIEKYLGLIFDDSGGMVISKKEVTLDYLKGKYKFILELLDEYRDEIENDENIGILS